MLVDVGSAVGHRIGPIVCARGSWLQVVSLMGDVALLAAALAIAQQQQHQRNGQQPGGLAAQTSAEQLCAAAAAQLASWLGGARVALTQGGILPAEAMDALLSKWDWQPVLQQAVLQLVQQQQQQQQGQPGGAGGASSSSNGGSTMAEVRRGMQRSVRQLADLIRRSQNGSSGPNL